MYKRYYNVEHIVDEFVGLEYLQPPEEAIMDRIGSSYSSMRVLDIGVGAGRTTQFFAKNARAYVGIDYSQRMILACQERHQQTATNISFAVNDGGHLAFTDGSFEFVLFSFNGLDHVDHFERLSILRAIRRVCSPGGYFCFSSHNLNAAGRISSMGRRPNVIPAAKMRLQPKTIVNVLARIAAPLIARVVNPTPSQLAEMDHTVLFDELSGIWPLWAYYIRPHAQIEQLASVGFTDVEVYSLAGEKITEQTDLRDNTDIWVYYLCRPR